MKKVTSILLIILTVFLFCSCKAKDDLYIKIRFDSMAPDIRGGDVIVIKDLRGKPEADQCKVGDIITYYSPFDINGDGRSDNDIETHQITKVRTANGFTYYTTMGTNYEYSHGIEDPEIMSTSVIGKYTGKKKNSIFFNLFKFWVDYE